MYRLELLMYPDERLKQKANPFPVESITHPETGVLLHEMMKVMHGEGVGLAAPQVNIPLCIILYTNKRGEIVPIFNPRILARSGKRWQQEACLSVPFRFAWEIRRAKTVTVDGFDIHGNLVRIKESNLQAAILQHEIDHLNGIEFLDRIRPDALKHKAYALLDKKIAEEKEPENGDEL